MKSLVSKIFTISLFCFSASQLIGCKGSNFDGKVSEEEWINSMKFLLTPNENRNYTVDFTNYYEYEKHYKISVEGLRIEEAADDADKCYESYEDKTYFYSKGDEIIAVSSQTLINEQFDCRLGDFKIFIEKYNKALFDETTKEYKFNIGISSIYGDRSYKIFIKFNKDRYIEKTTKYILENSEYKLREIQTFSNYHKTHLTYFPTYKNKINMVDYSITNKALSVNPCNFGINTEYYFVLDFSKINVTTSKIRFYLTDLNSSNYIDYCYYHLNSSSGISKSATDGIINLNINDLLVDKPVIVIIPKIKKDNNIDKYLWLTIDYNI